MAVLAQENKSAKVTKQYYAVVYQFGKVASTSIVATLDDIPGIRAVQSHFLGEAALSSIIPTITGADVSQYFFQHQLGQFIHNTKVTRQINRIRAGQGKERLIVISLSRDPIDWIRSSIVQDMGGYLDPLKVYAARHDLSGADDGAIVASALSHMLEVAADLIAAEGGIDAAIEALQKRGPATFAKTPFEGDPGAQRILRMMLRPFDWFERHYRTALGIGLGQMTRTDLGLEYNDDTGHFLVTKYEDIAQSIPEYMRRLGVTDISQIKNENTSEKKPFSAEIADVFRGASTAGLRQLIDESRYSKTFEYFSKPLATVAEH